ncbi:MAG: carbamoyltransferase HypF [Myxococcota bacterium]
MATVRRELHLGGIVQGVGLRPWALREAGARGLAGHVRNRRDGVLVVLEGEERAIDDFLAALAERPPAGARVETLRRVAASPQGECGFAVVASEAGRASQASGAARVPPDAATCRACLREMFDPADRRYRHAFPHCTDCGPRASTIHALPWDRERTSMRDFPPCDECLREYADPADRRFHAQAIACPRCGPRLRACAADGREPAGDPLEAAAACLAAGGIVALKGYGGFHLAVDATRPEAVARLRKRKRRPAKPLALLVPDLARARRLVRLDAADEALLTGPHAVVVAPRRPAGVAELGLAEEVAPGIRDLGVLLPVAPVHWLLLFAPGAHPSRDGPRFPALVLTSANRSGEPTVHRNDEARRALGGIADLWLEHDRDVVRPNDDPVYRAAGSTPVPIRLSRATAPRALTLPDGLRADAPVLALGGDLKCAPALAHGGEILLAEHLGDLGSVASADALPLRARELCRLVGTEPRVAVHDGNPDYVSSALAPSLAPATHAVQHHHAHAAACLVEHGRTGPCLALALDGAGLGPDGSLWGGELLRVDLWDFERLAHLPRVRLPGGDAAVREPWRMAAAWLDHAFPDGAPPLAWQQRRDPARLATLRHAAARGVNSPWTSSCGRLFDAVASLLDLCEGARHEGEGAMRLEALASTADADEREDPVACDLSPRAAAPWTIPAADLVARVAGAHAAGRDRAGTARRFHRDLAARLVAAAAAAARASGLRSVVLTGGCLQNRLLAAELRRGLEERGLEPLAHRVVPPSDAGLAVGQAAVAVARAARPGDAGPGQPGPPAPGRPSTGGNAPVATPRSAPSVSRTMK